MLVSAAKMLKDAKAGKYAVGHFNINNLEWTKAILLTAQELNSPVILGVSEGAGKYMCGFKTVTAMVDAMVDELGIPFPSLFTSITAPMRARSSASRRASPPSCSTALTTALRKTLQRQRK